MPDCQKRGHKSHLLVAVAVAVAFAFAFAFAVAFAYCMRFDQFADEYARTFLPLPYSNVEIWIRRFGNSTCPFGIARIL